jgi:acyl-CoA thioester hydrolase
MTTPAGGGKLLILTSIELRWRDLDALNHVNNASFLTFFEEARLRWFATLTQPWTTAAASPVVAAIHINYRRQLGWPQSLVAELRCERIGRTSLTIAHRLVDAGDRERVFADGNTVLVWVEPDSGKAIALPDVIVSACQ